MPVRRESLFFTAGDALESKSGRVLGVVNDLTLLRGSEEGPCPSLRGQKRDEEVGSSSPVKKAPKRQSNPCIIRGYFALIVCLVKRSMLQLLCPSFGYAWALFRFRLPLPLRLLLPLSLRLLARKARLV